jgi:hypothetical protein
MELAAAEAAGNDMRTLRSIARKHIALADRGDIQAIKELADRLDGKPAQAVRGDPAPPLCDRGARDIDR